MHDQSTPAPSLRQTRESNPNWRGGRVVASNGYTLVRVGVDHPLADVRGYAYEHRIVASETIGRPLRPGELVHHKNGDKQDNRPENLEVVRGNAEHYVKHRTVGFDRRLPGESNPTVSCGCGCGETFLRFDKSGRPRDFVSGHNPIESPAIDAILSLLQPGRVMNRCEIADAVNASVGVVASTLSKLKSRGLVENPHRGLWARKDGGNA